MFCFHYNLQTVPPTSHLKINKQQSLGPLTFYAKVVLIDFCLFNATTVYTFLIN